MNDQQIAHTMDKTGPRLQQTQCFEVFQALNTCAQSLFGTAEHFWSSTVPLFKLSGSSLHISFQEGMLQEKHL